jgi:hypothetical protein
MPQIRGIKGEVVVVYCEPLITKEMGCYRLSAGKQNRDKITQIHISLMVEIVKRSRIIEILIEINIL